MTNAKLLTFISKRQTVSGKRGENMVTWSLLPFAVCRKRDSNILALAHGMSHSKQEISERLMN